MLLTLFNSIQRRNHHPQRTEQSVNTTELNNTRYLVRTGFRTRPVLYRVPGTGTGTVMGLVPTVPGTGTVPVPGTGGYAILLTTTTIIAFFFK